MNTLALENIISTTPRPHLGLVCVTSTDEVRFKTITRTRYLKLAEAERETTLHDLYAENLRRLNGALTYCDAHGIRLYRMSSQLFPMSDLPGDPTGAKVLEDIRQDLGVIGRRAEELNIRVVMHPDQFVVLNSESPAIVASSIVVMERHARTLDLMGLPITSWTAMCIHGGKGGRSDQMVAALESLPFNVRNRIALENDEHAYGAAEILAICQQAGVPMIFDVHHHVCHDRLETLEDPTIEPILLAARATWPHPEWQLVHLSNGRDAFADPAHHDFITNLPSSYRSVPWIEVEAKMKEQAINRLRLAWPEAD